MRAITFDIESISDSMVRGHIDVNEQELTVVAIHDSETGAYTSFFKEDLPRLWPILERADMLIGFNSDTFDIPLLNRYYPGDLTHIRSLDLLSEVAKVLGRRIRLQSIAEATLGRGKKGDGLKAGEWWKEGKRDKVAEYCIEDVRLTRELYDYALKHGILKYKDLRDKRDIKIDTSHWNGSSADAPAMTHALGL
ncbi:MAG: ribonuclease H-like domain-containing protein [Candidatus Pacebacteria bacterium]|jgi:DEAD/DEAH box helicase domain-containing protein|nr:ribonuclease H-like domain-containing protein [Candidatus Paceibacterota bacterium]